MEFFQTILDGFVVFAVNAACGGLFFILFRASIRRRISEWLQDELSGYIRAQLTVSIQHADETAQTLAPLIRALMREVLKDFQKGQSEGMVKIPFLGKVPPQLVQMFLERFLGGNQKKSEGSNPFA
jgi:hypothetical protein